jgi:hypothetical protein
MKTFPICFSALVLSSVFLLGGCIHIKHEGRDRVTRTTTTTTSGEIAPSTTVQRTTVVDR